MTSALPTICPRRARARSCAACCGLSRAAKEITQDVSTLENPAIIDQLRGVDRLSRQATTAARKASRKRAAPGKSEHK